MSETQSDTGFVTAGRIALARNLAAEYAEKDLRSSAAALAEKAVRRVFGRWLEDPTAAIRPQYLPLYWQLVGRVQSELGVHRATGRRWRSLGPGLGAGAGVLPSGSAGLVHAVAATAAEGRRPAPPTARRAA